jgi:hypothetical protein
MVLYPSDSTKHLVIEEENDFWKVLKGYSQRKILINDQLSYLIERKKIKCIFKMSASG